MRLELTILGTASQSPTRERAQGGYVLRWHDELVLFDPGEGCQLQLLKAGISAARITRVCITHFHGDHCLGLPGFVQSRALATDRSMALHYHGPERSFVDHLLAGTAVDFDLHLDHQPMVDGDAIDTHRFSLSCRELDHPEPAIGYRLEEPGGLHIDPDRAEQLGLSGEQLGQLARAGEVSQAGRTIKIDDVAGYRRGAAAAFVMDTDRCPGAEALAADADLLICESTFLEAEAHLAMEHGHLTAAGAAAMARDAGAGLLVLSHYSQRYDDISAFETEARQHFAATIAARDLMTVVYDAKARRLITSG